MDSVENTEFTPFVMPVIATNCQCQWYSSGTENDPPDLWESAEPRFSMIFQTPEFLSRPPSKPLSLGSAKRPLDLIRRLKGLINRCTLGAGRAALPAPRGLSPFCMAYSL